MAPTVSRRQFLHAGAGTALLGLTDLSALAGLRPVSAAEANLDPNLVRLQPDIEPLVRFIETTPRDQLIEATADRVHKGLPYRDLLAALLLAGVRGIRPRPNVGFKFHAVWSSTPPTWPASPRPTRSAGCRSSGRSTTSSSPRPPTTRRVAGG